MARARNIKPSFFKNEDLVEFDFGIRLLFIGLWTLADREGRLEDRPKRIKMEIFPADDMDVPSALHELESSGFIERYEVNGLKVIQIINFLKHQRPHNTEKASELPAKSNDLSEKDGYLTVKEPLKPGDSHKQDGENLPDSLNPDSLNPESLEKRSSHAREEQSSENIVKPAATLSILARKHNISVSSLHPIVLEWVDAGCTPQILAEAITLAKDRKPDKIPAGYLTPIIKQLISGISPRAGPRRSGFGDIDYDGEAIEAGFTLGAT